MTKTSITFSLIGPGRVGSSMGQALCEIGWRCGTIIRATKSAKELSILRMAFPETRIVASISDMRDDFDVLLITVQDDEIPNVVAQLSKVDGIEWNGKVIFHVSGAIDVDVLSSLRTKGASVGAFHPISAFANKLNAEATKNIFYDFLGDRNAEKVAGKIVRGLNSKLLILKSEKERILLHLASTFASNSTVIAIRSAERLISSFTQLSDARNLMENLLRSTFRNLSGGTNMESLTGPLKRGDVTVITKHIGALENERGLLQFYKSWSLLAVKELLKAEHDASRKARLKQIKKILEAN
ncbi:MAG: DUF2520 domain-containing protein [Candidatus Kryptoniota bacterium]